MTADDCYQLGHIVKKRGKSNVFEILLDVSHPEEYQNLESVFVEIDNKLVPFFLASIAIQPKKKAHVTFEDLLDEDSTRLSGKKLFLPLSNLPELNDQHFYFHEITGFTVEDEENGTLGTVQAVYEGPAQDILSILHSTEKEILVPLTDEVFKRVDRETKTLHIAAPDGLVDIYLES